MTGDFDTAVSYILIIYSHFAGNQLSSYTYIGNFQKRDTVYPLLSEYGRNFSVFLKTSLRV